MNNTIKHAIRSSVPGMAAILCALLLSACGAPRVHETYRLTSLDDAAESSLTTAQQDLRRLALQARQLQPKFSASLNDTALAMLAPGNLQECSPEHLAQFTALSAFAIPGEQAVRYQPIMLARAGL